MPSSSRLGRTASGAWLFSVQPNGARLPSFPFGRWCSSLQQAGHGAPKPQEPGGHAGVHSHPFVTWCCEPRGPCQPFISEVQTPHSPKIELQLPAPHLLPPTACTLGPGPGSCVCSQDSCAWSLVLGPFSGCGCANLQCSHCSEQVRGKDLREPLSCFCAPVGST